MVIFIMIFDIGSPVCGGLIVCGVDVLVMFLGIIVASLVCHSFL
jgi:hypothetical protein